MFEVMTSQTDLPFSSPPITETFAGSSMHSWKTEERSQRSVIDLTMLFSSAATHSNLSTSETDILYEDLFFSIVVSKGCRSLILIDEAYSDVFFWRTVPRKPKENYYYSPIFPCLRLPVRLCGREASKRHVQQ